ncbi:hypothetical protein [Nocardiopsis synnemataformans]|uniref:hypothetical protein n=1 Tax=Nocardiopsis synnemataformans TaxID=61305 RepID=UPI003EB9DF99
MNAHCLPDLLTAAAHVLDQTGELPSVTITCNPGEQFLPAVVLTPASLGMDAHAQAEMVRTVAQALGWSTERFHDGQRWSTTGQVDEVEVQANAAPLRTGFGRELARTSDVSTAEHATLLRDLVDCSATVPEDVTALEVSEDLHGQGRFKARLVLPRGADPAAVTELVLAAADDSRSSYRGSATLPTGHALAISADM